MENSIVLRENTSISAQTAEDVVRGVATEVSPANFDALMTYMSRFYMDEFGIALPKPEAGESYTDESYLRRRDAYIEAIKGRVGSNVILSGMSWIGQYFSKVLKYGYYAIPDFMRDCKATSAEQALAYWFQYVGLDLVVHKYQISRLTNMAAVVRELHVHGIDVEDAAWGLIMLDDDNQSINIPLLIREICDVVKQLKRSDSDRVSTDWRDSENHISDEVARFIADAISADMNPGDFRKKIAEMHVLPKDSVVITMPDKPVAMMLDHTDSEGVIASDIIIRNTNQLVLNQLAKLSGYAIEARLSKLGPAEQTTLKTMLDPLVDWRFDLGNE